MRAQAARKSCDMFWKDHIKKLNQFKTELEKQSKLYNAKCKYRYSNFLGVIQ